MNIASTSVPALAELGDTHHAAGALAPTPRTLPADPSFHELQRLIEDLDAIASSPGNVHVRAILPDYLWEDSEYLIDPPSPTSSMAVSVSVAESFFERSVASSRVSLAFTPSLGPCSTAKSESSIHTNYVGSSLDLHRLDTDSNGVPIVPAQMNHPGGSWICTFAFLDCKESFSNPEQWETHCKSHLRGHLPSKLECPFAACGWKTVAAESGEEAWDQCTRHIVAEHRGQERAEFGRPAQSLLEHMLRCKLIDLAAYKELRLHGRVVDGYVFTSSAGPVSDQRRERRDRGTNHRRR